MLEELFAGYSGLELVEAVGHGLPLLWMSLAFAFLHYPETGRICKAVFGGHCFVPYGEALFGFGHGSGFYRQQRETLAIMLMSSLCPAVASAMAAR